MRSGRLAHLLALIGLGGAGGCAAVAPGPGVAVTAGVTSDQWTVRWDPVLRTPTLMTNQSLQDQAGFGRGQAISDSAAEAAARGVFRDRADWFRMRPGVDDLLFYRSQSKGWLRALKFVQTYAGVPVMGAGYEVTVLPNGRVGSIEGRLVPDLHIDVRPSLSMQQASDIARAQYAAGAAEPTDAARLYFENEPGAGVPGFLALVSQGDQFVLAWGVVATGNPRSLARIYVDANHAAVLGSQLLGYQDPR